MMIEARQIALVICAAATAMLYGPGTGAWAQEPTEQKAAITAADTSSPRDTLRSFVEATNELHNLITTSGKHYDRTDPDHIAIAERALDCLDDSELPAFTRGDRAGQAAVALKEILDRVKLPPWDQIPDTADIKAAGGFEKLSDYRIPDTRITISRVEQGPRRHEYLFSPGTVERAPSYFRTIESRPYRDNGPTVSKEFYRWYLSAPGHPALGVIVDKLPQDLRLARAWGLAIWKWLGLLITVLIGLALMRAAYRAHNVFTNRCREKGLVQYWLTIAFPTAAMLIPLGVEYVGYRYLTMRGTPLYVLEFSATLLALVAALVVIFAATNRTAATIISSPHINPAGLNAQLIRITCKLAGLVAAVILFLIGGQYLGIPIATLLASAGIGGVAIALGAQDTLKTLFGTLMLLSDKPFRVGERIRFKEYDGVVEDIGLRSTQLRLLSGPQVTLPNDQLAGNDVENVGRQKYIRRVGEIHIPLDSPYEQMAEAVEIIRDELRGHEGMDPDRPPRVFFDEFTPAAFSIKFIYWYSPPDYWRLREFSDKLNFAIFRRFQARGIQFSLPFRHSFWKHDDEQGPLDVTVLSQ
jgi:MscS family membrane protein